MMLILFNYCIFTLDYALYSFADLNNAPIRILWAILTLVNLWSLFISITSRFGRIKFYDFTQSVIYALLVRISVVMAYDTHSNLALILFALAVLTAVGWYRLREKEME
jgi:hypothetical protein